MTAKSIIIIGDSFTFPDGNAATNRVYTYAHGFNESGVKAHIICFRNDYLASHAGEVNGIAYYYPFRQATRSPYFFVRRWHNILKYYNTIKIVQEIKKDHDIMAIIAYTVRMSTFMYAWLLSLIFRTNLLLERSEHPLKEITSRTAIVAGYIKTFIEAILSNGIICISDYLRKFYRSVGAREKKLLLVPSTVDFTRFEGNFSSFFDFRYICYCGSLTYTKDGVHILLESFARITDKYPDIRLVLIGKADTLEDEQNLRALAQRLGTDQKTHFTGVLSRDLIPAYLCNAEVLVLSRPKSIVADAGFPSKVTEYLSTGKPIVVTRVGEIPVYLTDNVNAFLAEPDDIDDFANKLDYVLSNYQSSLEVGIKGKELVASTFNYRYQSKRIIEFLKTM
jgi:glycosyltransferase involved in cell wall biosynthesis